jgi:hypothetical protein
MLSLASVNNFARCCFMQVWSYLEQANAAKAQAQDQNDISEPEHLFKLQDPRDRYEVRNSCSSR